MSLDPVQEDAQKIIAPLAKRGLGILESYRYVQEVMNRLRDYYERRAESLRYYGESTKIELADFYEDNSLFYWLIAYTFEVGFQAGQDVLADYLQNPDSIKKKMKITYNGAEEDMEYDEHLEDYAKKIVKAVIGRYKATQTELHKKSETIKKYQSDRKKQTAAAREASIRTRTSISSKLEAVFKQLKADIEHKENPNYKIGEAWEKAFKCGIYQGQKRSFTKRFENWLKQA